MSVHKTKFVYNNLIVILVVISVSVMSVELGAEYGIHARQLNPTTRPLAPGNAGNVVGVVVTTMKPQQLGGSEVVEIQTPPTTPSNLISVINAKPAETATVKPIQTTARPIQTTKPTTARPIQTTRPGSNVNVNVSVRPGTTVPIPSCPLVNIMAIKTGFLAVANDPCSYVSCIRDGVTVYCAIVKCDPGFAFSTASNRCLQSNQCSLRPK